MDQKDNAYSIKTQSTKGLSTFVLTLSISLIVFSAIYYFMTTNNTSSDSEYSDFSVGVVTEQKVEEKTEESAPKPMTQGNTDSDGSVFGKLASTSRDSYSGQVLAGTDVGVVETELTEAEVPQTTQSNLQTGVTSITFGLFSALALFLSGMIFIRKGPRKVALSTFEKNITGRI